MFNSQNWKFLRRRAKPTIAEGTTQATANTTITNAGFRVGTVGTTATQNSGLNGVVTPAVTDTAVTPLGTNINYNVGVFSPPAFFGPPSFFGPPVFFGPPGFFAPPDFFAPPVFFAPPAFK
jgi:hypothetical protein